jgi:hypothetical protein
MEIMDIIIVLAGLVVCSLALVGVYTLWLYHKVKQHFVDNVVAKMIADSESNLIGLEVEVTNGVYFCYNIDNHQFVCQGATVQNSSKNFTCGIHTKMRTWPVANQMW